MTTLPVRRRLLVALLAGAGTAVLLPWAPVRADHRPPNITSFVVDGAQMAADPQPSPPVATSNPVGISVTADALRPPPEPDGYMREIRLSIAPAGDAADRAIPAPVTHFWGDDEAERRRTVTWSPALVYNGRYVVTAQVRTRDFASTHENNATRSAAFAVEVAPEAPTGVKVDVDGDDRRIAVSWNPNPEPDIVGYVLERSYGENSPVEIATTDAACHKSPPCSHVDDLDRSAGGEYRYQVSAVRRAADADKLLVSAPSKRASGRMPSNPAPTTTAPRRGTTGGGSGGGSGNFAGVGVTRSGNGRTGTVDLSGFASSLPQRGTVQRQGGGEYTGFAEQLPFDVDGSGGEEGGGTPDDQLAILRESPTATDSESNGPLVFVAAGLLATVLLMHVLWLKGEVEKVPLEAVAPVTD